MQDTMGPSEPTDPIRTRVVRRGALLAAPRLDPGALESGIRAAQAIHDA